MLLKSFLFFTTIPYNICHISEILPRKWPEITRSLAWQQKYRLFFYNLKARLKKKKVHWLKFTVIILSKLWFQFCYLQSKLFNRLFDFPVVDPRRLVLCALSTMESDANKIFWPKLNWIDDIRSAKEAVHESIKRENKTWFSVEYTVRLAVTRYSLTIKSGNFSLYKLKHWFVWRIIISRNSVCWM